MDRYVNVPLSEKDAHSLKAGDYVYLTGTIYTARDAAHKRMQETSSHMEQVLGSVSFQIPHSREVETQYLEGDMLAELGLKESRAFRKEIEKISKEVFGV